MLTIWDNSIMLLLATL